jgi:hypothetical protein
MGLDVVNLERKKICMFEGYESSISDVKLPFLGKLYDWIACIQNYTRVAGAPLFQID